MLPTYIKLLIFGFYFLWGFRSPDIEVQHLAGPAGIPPRPQLDQRPVLNMAADGTLEFEGRAVTAEDLERILTERVRRDPAAGLQIESAAEVGADQVWKIVELANRAGIESVGTSADVSREIMKAAGIKKDE